MGLAGRKIRYEALQSEAGKQLLMRSGRAPDDISSVVLVEKERYVLTAQLVEGRFPISISYWCSKACTWRNYCLVLGMLLVVSDPIAQNKF